MSAVIARADARCLPLPDASVDLVVTSPPYFGQRTYEDSGAAVSEQIGAEASPVEFLDALIEATHECVRVLKPSGSMWVNLGDKYRNKALAGLPWRYAIRCTDELGLHLRSEVVWSKSNHFIDAKAAGRVRRTHETWFHFTTQTTGVYDGTDAVREKPEKDYTDRPQYRRAVELFDAAGLTPAHLAAVKAVGIIDSSGGQVRSGGSWTSESGRLAAEVRTHLGSYYRELCGGGTRDIGVLPGSVWSVPAESLKLPAHLGVKHFAAFPTYWPRRIITGWSPPGGVVLDHFGGVGTTALVAKALGRVGVSFDLSADYCRAASWRCTDARQLARAA